MSEFPGAEWFGHVVGLLCDLTGAIITENNTGNLDFNRLRFTVYVVKLYMFLPLDNIM